MNHLHPKFSIITVTYNAGKVLEDTIQSVIFQTYRNVEYIIVDGNSKDNTMDIVNKYRNHISKVISEPDKGPLSDASSFMPDFIKLMANGLEQTLPVLEKASADIASALVPGAMQNSGANATTYNTPVNITVYGAQGQDVNQLADAVSRRLATLQRQRATAYVS